LIQAAVTSDKAEHEYHIQSILLVICASFPDNFSAFTVIYGIGRQDPSETRVSVARGLVVNLQYHDVDSRGRMSLPSRKIKWIEVA
jgi:hypothetical protein